jgi:hypothetical protein
MAKNPLHHSIAWIDEKCEETILEKEITVGIPDKEMKLFIKANRRDYGPFIAYGITTSEPCVGMPSELHPLSMVDALSHPVAYISDIVPDNEMMRKILNYISLDDDELEKLFPKGHPLDTRARLIYSLEIFFD